MKRILIFTDSLGLPRKTPEPVSVHETWPNLLKQNFEVYQVSLGGATIEDIYNQAHYYTAFNPDLVIVQAGIVDCAPRALSRLESINLNSFWFTRGTLSKIMPKYGSTIRKFRNKVYTPLADFQEFAQKINALFSPVPVFWIGIVPAQSAYEEKVPGISANIWIYNKKLAEIFKNRFIDISAIPPTVISSDFHHLNAAGNAFVAEKILREINGAV